MPLIHVQDIEPMADNIRHNVIKYMMDNHNIEMLDDKQERDLYNYIFMTVQAYLLNPPTDKKQKIEYVIIFIIILILIFICIYINVNPS